MVYRNVASGFWTCALLVTGLILGGTALADDETGGEIGIIGGALLPDETITGPGEDDVAPALGIRVGTAFAPNWTWFVDGLYSVLSTPGDDTDVITGRTGFEYLFTPDRDARFFLGLGGGWADADYGSSGDTDWTFASASLGQRFHGEGRRHYRWELRYDRSFGDDEGLTGDTINQIWALAGITWGPGTSVDSDGDGVSDGRDDCPDTPRGAIVDARGCPMDEDKDGVWDGLDKCPRTEAGWPVNPDGCPKDSDGDGVYDGEDACPDTPRGAIVDERGCPKDADGDGVADGIDKCPDTPKGAKVDAAGCPKDSDGDGVADGIDKCPDTPRGARVDASGCPKDSDGDGVYDGIDRCDGTPAGVKVDASGCPESKPLFEEGKDALILEGVNFEVNTADLTSKSTAVLDRVARSLREWPAVLVEVGGHTDSTGRAGYNQQLSEARAKSVRDYLVSVGVQASRLKVRGYGEEVPIADNDSTAGRALNRRVELRKIE